MSHLSRCVRVCAVPLVLFALLIGMGACGTTQSISPQADRPTGFASWTDSPPVYRFEPGDKLKVEFLLTPEMGEDAIVAPDGTIGLRAAGHVRAAGLTAKELEAAITQNARRLLTDPIVTVSLNDPAAALVFVGGSVSKPGAYPVPGRRGALESILLAGGFGTEARMDEVVLIRRNPEDRPMLRTLNLQKFVSTAGDSGDVPLYPGDIVFVPRNRISEIDLWIDQYINRFLPFSRSFGYAINNNAPAAMY